MKSQNIKKLHYLLPIMVLCIVSVWLYKMLAASKDIKQDNAYLSEKIDKARNSRAVNSLVSNAKPRIAEQKKEPSQEKLPLEDVVAIVTSTKDWKVIARLICDGWGIYESDVNIRKLFAAMSPEELDAAYAEIADVASATELSYMLEEMMLDELRKKSPELAFTKHMEKFLRDDSVPQDFTKFQEWLGKDSAAALAWYEKKLGEGSLDKSLVGLSTAFLPFEAAIIKLLIETDPAAAEERMMAIPAEQRTNALVSYMYGIADEDKKILTDLIRKTMPMEEFMMALKSKVMPYRYPSFPEEIKGNFDSISATPEERATLLKLEAGRRLSEASREQFDEFRTWAKTADPSSADQATADGLVRLLKNSADRNVQEFVEKTAIDYRSSGSGDELLIPLIEESGKGTIPLSKERARVLAMQIED